MAGPAHANDMDQVLFHLVLGYAFLVGIKLAARRTGDLRAAGVILAGALVPLIALGRWNPDVLGSLQAFGITLGVRFFLLAIFGTLFGVELLIGLLSFLRVRKRGEDYVRIHKALLRIGLLLVVFPIVLKARYGADLDFGKVLASAAVGSIIIGLALQNTLANLFAGLGVEAENMLQQGEFVQIGHEGPRGFVIEKTWRSTRVQTQDGQTIFVPNNELGRVLLFNYDRPTRVVALRIQARASYEDPPILVKETIHRVLVNDPEVLADPAPQVWTRAYEDSSIGYEARFWIPSMRLHTQIRDRVMTGVWYAFKERGITIPLPGRTMHMIDPDMEQVERTRRHELMESASTFLGSIEPFRSHCLLEDLHFLAENGIEQRHAAGRPVVRKGARSEAMYVIRDGTCDVLLPDGQRKTLRAGDYFGEIGLLRGTPRTADVVAGEAGAVTLRLGREAVRALLSQRQGLRDEFDRTGELRLGELAALEPAPAPAAKPLSLARALQLLAKLLRPW